MGANSKAKGSNFERKVANILSTWSGYNLRRTPQSGGWEKGNPDVAGDIVCVDKNVEFKLHIECKNQEGWKWESILLENSKLFESWWDQCKGDCPKGKFPLLIFSKAYHEDWVLMYYREFMCNLRPLVHIGSGLCIVPLKVLLYEFKYDDLEKLI